LYSFFSGGLCYENTTGRVLQFFVTEFNITDRNIAKLVSFRLIEKDHTSSYPYYSRRTSDKIIDADPADGKITIFSGVGL